MSTASPQPYRPPVLSRTQIRLHNLLTARRPRFELELDDAPLPLVATPAVDGKPPASTIELAANGARFWVQVEAGLMRRICAPWIGDGDPQALPGALRQALLAAALGPFMDRLREATGIDLTLDGDGHRPPPDDTTTLALHQPLDGGDLTAATLWLDAAAAELLAGLLQALPAPSSELPDLALPVGLEVGRTRLTAAELRELETDDVLLLGIASDAAAPLLALRAGDRLLATARLTQGRIQIEQIPESMMTETDQTPPGDADGVAIDELEIELHFDLGSLSLSLEQLRQLRPGHSFELGLEPTGAVRIHTGGRLIGRGELVQIDGRLGVRITALNTRGDD